MSHIILDFTLNYEYRTFSHPTKVLHKHLWGPRSEFHVHSCRALSCSLLSPLSMVLHLRDPWEGGRGSPCSPSSVLTCQCPRWGSSLQCSQHCFSRADNTAWSKRVSNSYTKNELEVPGILSRLEAHWGQCRGVESGSVLLSIWVENSEKLQWRLIGNFQWSACICTKLKSYVFLVEKSSWNIIQQNLNYIHMCVKLFLSV